MTPEQLRELIESLRNGSPLPTDDAIALAIAHADALEELARVKKAISESCDEQRGEYFGCRRAERAEAALAESERKCERVRFHAERMALELESIAHEEGYAKANCLIAYRAEFKEDRP